MPNKPYIRSTPNYGDNIEAASIVRVLAPPFVSLADDLSEVYYNEWQHGDYTTTFQGHKPVTGDTKVQAQALFDDLHGKIWNHYYIVFLAEVRKLPANDTLRQKMELRDVTDEGSLVALVQQKVAQGRQVTPP